MPSTASQRTLFTAIVLLTSGALWARTPNVLVYGMVKDQATHDSIPHATVLVTPEGAPPLRLNFMWDMEHTRMMRERQAAFLAAQQRISPPTKNE